MRKIVFLEKKIYFTLDSTYRSNLRLFQQFEHKYIFSNRVPLFSNAVYNEFMLQKKDFLRNFTIIAHVDHGKSTLADKFLLKCGAVDQRTFKDQLLDNMDLERERGITIKAQTARLEVGKFILNMVDTPGHSDFSYEVSRSLKACEISILLIDATKGMEAQTVANLYKAMEANHFILPVLNKIDLPSAQVEKCLEEMDKFGLDISEVQQISAKTGMGIDSLLQSILDRCPAPEGDDSFFRALVIDSWYDNYLGVITLIRVMDGTVKPGMKLRSCSNGKIFNVLSTGVFLPKPSKVEGLSFGEIGFLVTQVKNPSEIDIGDTFVLEMDKQSVPLEGFKKSTPLVFCTFYPDTPDMAAETHEALKKYRLNDSAFSFFIEHSEAYGAYFRCGFLGLLHLEIVKERLEREYEIFVIPTLPSVVYRVHLFSEKTIECQGSLPSKDQISFMEEPETLCRIFTTIDHIGKVTSLCMGRRAEDLSMDFQDQKVVISAKIPLSEIIIDFHDALQSITSGFASFEYEVVAYRRSNLVNLSVLVNDIQVKEFGIVVHESKAREMGKSIASKLKEIVPRGQYKIKIQVAIDSQIVAREDINPYRKDVIAKCYGGDITRKQKLLNKQKKGKSKMLDKNSGIGNDNILRHIPNNLIKTLLVMD